MPNKNNKTERDSTVTKANLFDLVRQYIWWILGLAFLTMAANALNLATPKIIADAIDNYSQGNFVLQRMVIQFLAVIIFISIFTYLQSILQTYASELVAKNLRTKLIDHISFQQASYIQDTTPARLLTNLTSDVDAVKNFVSQAISSIISSLFLIVGASIILIMINWKLALAIIFIIPIIGLVFYTIFGKVRKLFKRSQEAIDWLNKVINESILGATLIRLLNSRQFEYNKFVAANTESKEIGFSILRLFASLIPIVTFCANFATLLILSMGGHFVITGEMSLGDFTAFNSYLAILIFPIIIISFMSNVIAQAAASYQRIGEVLTAKYKKNKGEVIAKLKGDVIIKDISLFFNDRQILKNISVEMKAGTKTAIIGPTAAGKTQLLYLLTGLLEPSSGIIEFDSRNINDYEKINFHQQLGLVFQDSIIFNLSLRENIAFSTTVKDENLQKAIETAELQDFINALPNKLDSVVSERGSSLSGGQKQRIMLARALAINPKILLLDDFTARVDEQTEKKILQNIKNNYPDITLISVTQKIAPIEDYDQIILLMEGEILAKGKHEYLMDTSPEYAQIYDSQKSTNNYEI